MSERNPIRPPWRDISELKADDGLIFAAVAGDPSMNLRIMLWDAKILMENIKGPRPAHLQFPATHWFYLDELELPEV